jgi:hypothetical protein
MLICLFTSSVVSAQTEVTCSLNFDDDDTTQIEEIHHSPIKYHGSMSENIWQIGKPNKKRFTQTDSNGNVLITHLDSSYPLNDTSLYEIKFKAITWAYNAKIEVQFDYWLDTDSLKDHCRIWLATDQHSVDLSDTLDWGLIWHSEQPIKTGNTNGWGKVHFDLTGFRNDFGIAPLDWYSLIFMFLSDSTESNQDGMMIDNFKLTYVLEYWNVKEFTNSPITIYPNPILQHFRFKDLPSKTKAIVIRNSNGQLVEHRTSLETDQFDIGGLPSGTYILEVITETDRLSTKLIKQ